MKWQPCQFCGVGRGEEGVAFRDQKRDFGCQQQGEGPCQPRSSGRRRGRLEALFGGSAALNVSSRRAVKLNKKIGWRGTLRCGNDWCSDAA
ncbi:hypothetical protein DBR20_15920 [Stenotrophomonas sp. HMWF023]|nr:hypothetical protein DBR20_15920 [Stenotrophomonas sp. HMWF023]